MNTLVAAALEGEGWESLLARLEELCGHRCALIAVHGGVLAQPTGPGPAVSRPASGTPASDSTVGGLRATDVASAHGHDGPLAATTTDGRAVAVFAVAAGRRRVGALAVEMPHDEMHEDGELFAGATLALAIAASRRDAEAAVVADEASGLIAELRFGSGRDPEALRRSAVRFGLHLDRPHSAVVFAHEGANSSAWTAAVRWIETPTLLTDDTAWTILPGDPSAELHRIRERLNGIVGGDDTVVAASGATVSDISALPGSFREAEILLALTRSRHGLIATPATSGIDTVLLDVDGDRLRTFVTAALGPVLNEPALLETLEVWIDARASRVAAAEALDVHRNTIGYRIGRLRALLDVDLDDAMTTLRLRTAVAAHRLLSVTDTGHAPPGGPRTD
ncbi:MAG: helix-turn-helix domain-containing protein [Acidimicrobiales bacterium]